MAIDKTLLPLKINAFIAGKLQGKTPSSAVPVYSSQDPWYNGLGKFVRNPDCWLNGVSNISCFSPAQLSGAWWYQRAGTLITRKHVLFAKHFVPAVIAGGTPLVFVDASSNAVRRNVIQIALHPWTDIAIGLLDSEVPSNIKIAKVLPKNHTDYFSIGSSPMYCVGLDQQEKALVKLGGYGSGYIISYNGQSIYYQMFGVNEASSYNMHSSFNETIVTGDSGNPVFYIINNELVVTTTWWTQYGGPFISHINVYDTVNTLIESLSPGQGYLMTDVDLSLAYEGMRKTYFNPNGDGNYNNLGNWYQDSAFSVPATALPSTTDIPVMPWRSSAQRVAQGSGLLAAF